MTWAVNPDIRLVFIRPEELLLAETFNEGYLAYKSRVQRWF
ncbi:MAG: hypothetical protein O7B25_11815 [Gammaproteobacteria bacterium]|nr:hypothetical protein [Gammaproteobacteria bacterium]